MSTTHFAAVKDGAIVGVRSSTSRHAEGQGRFGLYTHAVLRTTRTTTKTDTGESVAWSETVISWHGGAANAAAGLRDAHVGAVYCYGADNSSYIEDPKVKHGVRSLTVADPQTVKVVTHVRAELVPVIVTPKKPKLGAQALPDVPAEPKTATCPGCNGAGVLTDDPDVLRCQGCGGVFTADYNMPITFEQALKFVALNQDMLANAGPDGSFYFDLAVATTWKDKPEVGRVHGWADAKTKRVVQFG